MTFSNRFSNANKRIGSQIRPYHTRPIGHGQPRIIIDTNCVDLKYLILHVEFQDNRTSGSRGTTIFCFYILMMDDMIFIFFGLQRFAWWGHCTGVHTPNGIKATTQSWLLFYLSSCSCSQNCAIYAEKIHVISGFSDASVFLKSLGISSVFDHFKHGRHTSERNGSKHGIYGQSAKIRNVITC